MDLSCLKSPSLWKFLTAAMGNSCIRLFRPYNSSMENAHPPHPAEVSSVNIRNIAECSTVRRWQSPESAPSDSETQVQALSLCLPVIWGQTLLELTPETEISLLTGATL